MDYEYLIKTFYLILQGIPVTLKLTIIPILIATPLALYMACIKIHKNSFITYLINAYITLMRGLPMVLQILLIYSLLPSLLNYLVVTNNLNIDIFAIDPIYYAYTIFTISSLAYLIEIYRSALLTVDIGQLEAALAIGMSKITAYKRIIIPQALPSAIPNLCNLTIYLIKATSLVFIMTIKDITAIAKIEAAYTYNYIESYLDVFIIYILICSIIQLLFLCLERYFTNHSNYTI